MKKTILITLLAILGWSAQAQDDSKIESLRREFITKELALTPQEADAFFPVYNEYVQKRKEARKSLRQELQNKDGNEPSVEKIIDKEQLMVDLQKEYLDKFSKIIPESKVVQLIEVEKKFKMMLVQKLKEKRG